MIKYNFEDISNWAACYLKDRYNYESKKHGDSLHGILDSVGVMDIISTCEYDLCVRVPMEKLKYGNFYSFRDLCHSLYEVIEFEEGYIWLKMPLSKNCNITIFDMLHLRSIFIDSSFVVKGSFLHIKVKDSKKNEVYNCVYDYISERHG
jgi:acyl carrier protein